MKSLITAALFFISTVGLAQSKLEEKPVIRVVNAFDLIKENKEKKQRYSAFKRNPSLSSGVYTLDKGVVDSQSVHNKDEIYYIVKGNAKIRIGTEIFDVEKGSMVFVEAYKAHKFFDITKDLAVVVVFSAIQPKKEK